MNDGTLIWSSGIDTQRRMEPVDHVARDLQGQLRSLPVWIMAEELTHAKALTVTVTLDGSVLHIDIQSATR